MAKKKPAAKRPRKADPPTLLNTSELSRDGANPRRISKRSAGGLSVSLDRFGDLSGIVWNSRTSELVCGHQRMDRIRELWGDRPIELVDPANRLYGIRVDEEHFFSVRVVDWSKAMQRAANVAANNQAIAGEFTEDLASYLVEIEADLAAEAPSLFDELLLAELVAAEEAAGPAEGNRAAPNCESYSVVIQCVDEEEQRRIFQRLKKEGLPCKVVTL